MHQLTQGYIYRERERSGLVMSILLADKMDMVVPENVVSLCSSKHWFTVMRVRPDALVL